MYKVDFMSYYVFLFRCGKTTMCQLYAEIHKSCLYSVNCHLHSESADFLGGLRPVRSHSEVSSLYSVNCHLHSESADFLGGLRPVRSHSEVSSLHPGSRHSQSVDGSLHCTDY